LEHGGVVAVVIDALIPSRPGGRIHDERVVSPHAGIDGADLLPRFFADLT
jgi:hypothetical protein